MKFKQPKPHQIDFANFHRRKGPYANYLRGLLGSMAWHGMGRGKTLSNLWEARDLLGSLRMQGVMSPKFMVICPASATPTWKMECHAETPDLDSAMLIYPYSQLHNAIKALKYWDVRMVIFDESHFMKSTETDRAKLVAAFLQEIGSINGRFQGGRIILATGTPLPNNASELYTSWAICGSPNPLVAADRLLDAKRFDDWRKTFSKKVDMNWVVGKNRPKEQQRKGHATKWEGVDNEDKLQQLLVPFVHFVEGSGDVPTPREIEINLGLDDDKLLENADIERPEAYMSLVEKLSRAKTPYMVQWVSDFLKSNKEQLLVFAMNRHPIDQLKERFPKDVRVIVGSGEGSSLKDRTEALVAFQKGQLRVLAMTYACGAESLNCQNAYISLYHGFPWNDAKRRQAMARTARTGQQRETLHYFMMSGYNDMKILNDVRAKGETEKKVEALFENKAFDNISDSKKKLLASFF